MVMLGGAGIAGYLYMRNHPDMVCYMKDAVKDTVRDTSRKVYNMLDEEDWTSSFFYFVYFYFCAIIYVL